MEMSDEDDDNLSSNNNDSMMELNNDNNDNINNEVFDEEDDDVNLPKPPSAAADVFDEKNVSNDEWINYSCIYLEKLGKFAYSINAWYHTAIVKQEEIDKEEREKILIPLYNHLSTYFIENSCYKKWTEVLSYTSSVDKHRNNDNNNSSGEKKGGGGKIKSKTSLRTHLFWELTRLRIIVRIKEIRIKYKNKCAFHYKLLVKQGIVTPILGIKPILNYSQKNLKLAFFILTKHWKTCSYSVELDEYINLLLDRLSMFFCHSFYGNILNVEEFRQELRFPDNFTLPLRQQAINPITAYKDTCDDKDDENDDDDDDDDDISSEEEDDLSINNDNDEMYQQQQQQQQSGRNRQYSNNNNFNTVNNNNNRNMNAQRRQQRQKQQQHQYAPNFDFVFLAQLWYYELVEPLNYFNSRPKKSLQVRLNSIKQSYILQEGRGLRHPYNRNNRPSMDPLKWMPHGFFFEWCKHKCQTIHHKFDEVVKKRYLQLIIPPEAREWLLFKKSSFIKSWTPKNILEQYVGPIYKKMIDKASSCPYDIFEKERNKSTSTGIYEWLILKLFDKMFGPDIAFFDCFIISRDDLNDNEKIVSFHDSSSRPLIVQFFSKYYVYYDFELFVDHKIVPSTSTSSIQITQPSPSSIYDTIKLWLYFMSVSKKGKKLFLKINDALKQELYKLQTIKGVHRLTTITSNTYANRHNNSSHNPQQQEEMEEEEEEITFNLLSFT